MFKRMEGKIQGKNVWVGLSGGVDSSVSAHLLKAAGHTCSGAFIKVWQPEGVPCTQEEDRLSASRVAATVGIPFKTVDLVDTYKRSVIDYMVREYEAGRTPNPDVLCNREVKFGAFLEHAEAVGAEYVATGHYAKKVFNEKSGLYELHMGEDRAKDQTYFLWALSDAQLSQTLFPIGSYEKSEVRAIAERAGLHTATRKDSQGLCFVGNIHLREFLSPFVESAPGVVLDTEGRAIGEHAGALFYTLGQRHGFSTTTNSSSKHPQYVVEKDVLKNTITVSDDPRYLATSYNHNEIYITDTNWIGGTPKEGEELSARLRHRQPLFSGALKEVDGSARRATFVLKEPQVHLPEGQALVLYRNTQCVGGGFIVH